MSIIETAVPTAELPDSDLDGVNGGVGIATAVGYIGDVVDLGDRDRILTGNTVQVGGPNLAL